MRIHLVAVGERLPKWVQLGYDSYAKRLPCHCALVLHEISPGRRGKTSTTAQAVAVEAERIDAAVPGGALRVALDIDGEPWSTAQLADRLDQWRGSGRDVALLVGGPDGLDPALRARCDLRWCLSPLTFPHALVRPIVAEQIYRAWSILSNHPYHRA